MPNAVPFRRRHIGPSPQQFEKILKNLEVESLDSLIYETIPDNIRQEKPLSLPPAMSEPELLAEAKKIAGKNKVFKSYIGMGYYGTHTPTVYSKIYPGKPLLVYGLHPLPA